MGRGEFKGHFVCRLLFGKELSFVDRVFVRLGCVEEFGGGWVQGFMEVGSREVVSAVRKFRVGTFRVRVFAHEAGGCTFLGDWFFTI